jgi:Prp8 binding protein
VCISPDGDTIYSGGIDNIIRRWDIKADTGVPNLTLEGHSDTITGLALSPDGTSLLSNAMDSTLRKWDVRPFTPAESRCVLHYDGVHHGAEKGLLRCAWSKDGELVTCGSADRYRFIPYFSAIPLLCILLLHLGAFFVVFIAFPLLFLINMLQNGSYMGLYVGEAVILSPWA